MKTIDELDKFLCETYPKMFVDRNKSMQETCMCWGFEVGIGWSNILQVLCSLIQWHIDQSEKDFEYDTRYELMRTSAVAGDTSLLNEYVEGLHSTYKELIIEEILTESPRVIRQKVEQVVVTQVKEKFGTLRFYYNGGDNYIDALVAMAEGMTARTCEECGNPGHRSDNGWIRVRCDKHEKPADDWYEFN